MLFTSIYIAMTFLKSWRIRSFRTHLLQFLSGNTSVAFCKVPENAAETPTLSSKLCINPKNAYLCDLLDYTNTTRVCSMKPTQCIEISDWVSCSGGLPLGSSDVSPVTELDIEVLFECEMESHELSSYHIFKLDSIGQPIAWKAMSHLAIVMKTNMEMLSMIGFNFITGEVIIDHKLPVVRIQTVQLSGEPNKATDASMRSLRSEIQNGLKQSASEFQWPFHATLLRKLSKVVDIKSENKSIKLEMNGSSDILDLTTVTRKNVSLADVSVNTGRSLNADDEEVLETSPKTEVVLEDNTPNANDEKMPEALAKPDMVLEKNTHNADVEDVHEIKTEMDLQKNTQEKSPEKRDLVSDNKKIVFENVTVQIQHSITPKKSNLKLDLKKGASQKSSSLLNISSQIKSVTTHRRIVSTTGPTKMQNHIEAGPQDKEDGSDGTLQCSSKSTKCIRPLVNTKSPNILIYSDSVAAKDNLETSLKKVLDCDRYTLYSVSRESLEAGAWRGRCALVAVAGCVGRAAPLLLAHMLDGGRLLALCSDLLHTVLPYYKTAEVRENEIVQFSYDKWRSVKMKHHIFCYQASPAKKQFSTESDRQPSKYTGHPGHILDIQVLASEETWRTPSLLQATDSNNSGTAIFSQIHLEADPNDYLGDEGARSNAVRLEILHKILGDILGLHVKEPNQIDKVDYTRGFFLGNHVQKLSLIEGWCQPSEERRRIQKLDNLTIQWCLRGETPVEEPSPSFLPVYVYECPEQFSTLEYFDNLTSTSLGRLLVYADVMSSTMLVSGSPLAHGVGAIARRQADGRGRSGNMWLSPPGQAAISIQVWTKMSPSLPLVQHAAALAAVRAVRSHPTYEHLDIRIKWPNDIYYGREVKIGGTIVHALCLNDDVILNIGTGLNISNAIPTTCVNDIIAQYNRQHGATLAPLSIEKYLARFCSQLELALDTILNTEGGVDTFLQQYYQYWLHDGEEIRVLTKGATEPVAGVIRGLDAAGWLRVETANGETCVTPDGNTFDIMSGLVTPKL